MNAEFFIRLYTLKLKTSPAAGGCALKTPHTLGIYNQWKPPSKIPGSATAM